MSEVKDDPREVLVLLNSLGFVGITATQLKAFMKDLKIYRKVKERERQQRKEEIKMKIISKQQALLKEAYRLHNTGDYSSNNIPSESPNSLNDESVVKVRIRCIPKEDDVQKQKYSKTTVIKSDEKLSRTKYDKEDTSQLIESDKIYCAQNYFNTKSYPIVKNSRDESKQNISNLVKNSHSAERCEQSLRIKQQMKPMTLVQEHPLSAPALNHMSRSESKSIISDPTGNTRAQSTLSAKSSVNFAHKSFIRPWRLQSEAQKNITNKKCDPVALYQKYQQEWKQISFPGEAKHSKIRWAVREKMLGTDPHPVPLSKKSTHMPILKRK